MKKDLTVIVVGFLALVYLLNPTAGILEFIPDNFPIIGNLDEAMAVTIILSALSHFGINLTNLFDKNKEPKKEEKKPGKTVIQIKAKE